ncbi:hypothetical protein PG984_010454 [Apiospora sp. TS-2023a]
MAHKQSPKTTQAGGSKKSQGSSANVDATTSKAKANQRHPTPYTSYASKNPTTKPSDPKSMKNTDVPVELWGVGAWCDDMPEPGQYKQE